MSTSIGTSIDPRCGYCGRPIIGESVCTGVGIEYHPECVGPPRTETLPQAQSTEGRWPWTQMRLEGMRDKEIKSLREKLDQLRDWTQKEMDRRFGIMHSKFNRHENECTRDSTGLRMEFEEFAARVTELERKMKHTLQNIPAPTGKPYGVP